MPRVEVEMPQELLRDVLRTGDRGERTRRRLSILPLSIAAHAVAAMLFLIMPLAAEVEVPPIASPFKPAYMETVPPPPPPAVRTPATSPQPSPAAPISAPRDIMPEPEFARGPVGEVVPGALDVGSTAGVPGGLITPTPPPEVLPPPPQQPRVARVGFQGIKEPKRIQYLVPEYPELARRAGISGTVILEAVLDVNGRVQSVRVLKSVTLLDEAAIRAVRQWRYTPTELNGVPVQVLMTITVNFALAR
jgi:protein TonB